MRLLLILLILILPNCDHIEELPGPCPEEVCSDGAPEPSPSPLPTPVPPTNPTVVGIQKFENGTLWKPCSDHGCTLVVLLNNSFVAPFDECLVERRNGQMEELRFTGFSNPDRMTLRGTSHGRDYMPNGKLICREFKQEVEWKIPRRPARRAE